MGDNGSGRGWSGGHTEANLPAHELHLVLSQWLAGQQLPDKPVHVAHASADGKGGSGHRIHCWTERNPKEKKSFNGGRCIRPAQEKGWCTPGAKPPNCWGLWEGSADRFGPCWTTYLTLHPRKLSSDKSGCTEVGDRSSESQTRGHFGHLTEDTWVVWVRGENDIFKPPRLKRQSENAIFHVFEIPHAT